MSNFQVSPVTEPFTIVEESCACADEPEHRLVYDRCDDIETYGSDRSWIILCPNEHSMCPRHFLSGSATCKICAATVRREQCFWNKVYTVYKMTRVPVNRPAHLDNASLTTTTNIDE